MKILLSNTLTKQKEEFKPIREDEVRIYSCGPTVYKDATIGNMRTNIFQDVLRRVLRYNGYKIKHAMNITDVGHLVSDGDDGEDKMIKSAREEKKTPQEIAEYYTELFFQDLKYLNIEKPEIICKATEHIQLMLDYVKDLIDRGFAYETSTAIYFDVSKLDRYPVLSNHDVRKQQAGARVEVDPEKKNPYDFAVWIKAPENHLMKWDSPWGPSYPGWHIECCAMGQHYLGEVFDIHTGGIDLIPTHHENEIAQSKGKCGKIQAHYWVHGEYLLIDGGKMSKSLGNVYLIKDIIDRGYDPLTYRLFTYSGHYKSKINFTWDAMVANAKSLERLRNGYQTHNNGTEDVEDGIIAEFENRFHEAINDDLNMPLAMGVVWEVIRYPQKSKKLADLLLKFDSVMALDIDRAEDKQSDIPEEILELVEQRKIARENKDWQKSDELRDLISEKGYIIRDTPNGAEVSKK